MKQVNGKTFLTENELLESLKDFMTSRVTLWRARKAGRLECYRIGGRPYYTPEQRDRFVESWREGERQDAA